MDAVQDGGEGGSEGEEKRHATVAIREVWQKKKKAGSPEELTGLSLPPAPLSRCFLLS
jgi:hypothetical protein